MKKFCQSNLMRRLSIATSIGLALIGINAHAQIGPTGKTVMVNGTIASVTGSDITLTPIAGRLL